MQRCDEYDVIVSGGGPAGFAAALSAARNGAKTLLIERYGFLGGMFTAAFVTPFAGHFDRQGNKAVGGIMDELVTRMKAIRGAQDPVESVGAWERRAAPIDPERFKYVSLQMLEEARADILLHTMLVDAVTQGDAVLGVTCRNKAGTQTMRAKVVVDATGDGDVAAAAGARFEVSETLQPGTLIFRLMNIDLERLAAYVAAHKELFKDHAISRVESVPGLQTVHVVAYGLEPLIKAAVAKGELYLGLDMILIIAGVNKGEVYINGTRAVFNGLDPFELTRAELDARKQVMSLSNWLMGHVPGFESAVLVDSGTQIGVRETRRVVGEYVLTPEDIRKESRFDDVVAKGSHWSTIHGKRGFAEPIVQRTGRTYDIPYRCLLPATTDGLLVAGRCVSATHEAMGSTRIMGTCVATGQAAGTAAALSVEHGVPPRKLDIRLLQTRLRDQGAIL